MYNKKENTVTRSIKSHVFILLHFVAKIKYT